MNITTESKEVFRSGIIEIKIQINSEEELFDLQRDIQDLNRSSAMVKRGGECNPGQDLLDQLMNRIHKLRENIK